MQYPRLTHTLHMAIVYRDNHRAFRVDRVARPGVNAGAGWRVAFGVWNDIIFAIQKQDLMGYHH